jgi:hypothetical protein
MKKKLHNYFIPSEENDHKPKSLQAQSIGYFIAILVIAELGFLVTVFSPISSQFKDNLAAILPSVLVLATNEARVERNMGSLHTNPQLERAAQLKANDMAEREFFAHVNPDGQQPWYYLGLAGYRYDAAGENLAVDFIDSDDVHRAWMKSPTHMANIVQSKFTEIGIATSRGRYEGKDVVFVVQFFGTPSVATPVVPQFTQTPQEVSVSDQEVVLSQTEAPDTTGVLGVEIVASESSFSEDTEVMSDSDIEEKQTTAVQDAESGDGEYNEVAEVANEAVESASVASETTQVNTVSDTESVSLSKEVASSPYDIISIIVAAIGILLVVALLFKIFIAVHIQHPALIMNALFVFVIILIITLVNVQILDIFGEVG